MSNVHYSIAILDPNKHLFEIKIDVIPVDKKTMTVSLANWLPGSYMIRDFAKHIINFEVKDSSGAIAFSATSKSQYQIKQTGSPFTITYQVYAFDMSVRKAYLDQEFGFINPASSLYQIDQFSEQPCKVTLIEPDLNGTLCRNWKPATGMKSTGTSSGFEFGEFVAANYLELTDYPVLYGDLKIAEFSVENIPHYIITVGRHFGDLERVAKDLTPLCQYHADTFGGLPKDLDQYLFMTMVTDVGFGGLEHLNSTALVCSRFDIPGTNQPLDDSYSTFLSLCSHEYLHTWNVKRLKPKEFIPYKLDAEVYTEQLWFYEGMTSYFDDLSLVQTNTIQQSQYLDLLAKTLTRIERGQGQLRQSVTQSSFHAWTKFYQQDHTAPDQIVSYYQKGAVIACLTDILIKHQTNGKQSLRCLMKNAWQNFGANNLGTTQDGLVELFINFLGEEHRSWFLALLYSNEKVTCSALFEKVGITLTKHIQTDPLQTHGNNLKDPTSGNWLGAVTTDKAGILLVKQVLNHSPIEAAGVSVGDELLALDGIRLTAKNMPNVLKAELPENPILHYFRKDQLRSETINLTNSPEFLIQLEVTVQEKLNKWLYV